MKKEFSPQAIESTPRSSAGWIVVGMIMAAMAASVNAQEDHQQLAYNAAMPIQSDYAKPVVHNQSQADFGDANLSAQQMVDFFKNEHEKLSKEINELIAKTAPDKQSSLAVDESDIQKVAILMNKLEYLEVIMTKWIKDGDF
jgi:hypothetical protein